MMPEKKCRTVLKTYQRDYSGFHMICSKEFLWQIFCEKSIIHTFQTNFVSVVKYQHRNLYYVQTGEN